MRPRLSDIGLTAALIIALFGTSCSAENKGEARNPALMKTHQSITQSYKTVPHLTAEDVINLNKDNYIIFDIREKKEFEVSHLKDAIWVDPSIKPPVFYEKYGDQIKDKSVILYCSVGVRSSRLAEKLLASEKSVKPEIQMTKIYNLENGIFGWHNESRPLFHGVTKTDFIHPYDRFWGRMLNRKDFKRYKREEI